jgi:DNA-binding winged helix-turn-helix (wHTH) protein
MHSHQKLKSSWARETGTATMPAADGSAQTEIGFGRWRLSPVRRRLLADGEPVALGSRAFDVLLALVEAHGNLVTKDALMRRVWPGTVTEDNSLQVQISALRKALGQDAAGLIATIPGRGYCFTGQVQPWGDVASPAEVQRPAIPPAAIAAATALADFTASRPVLAILPFINMSSDSE